MNTSSKLIRFKNNRRFVRFSRRFEDGFVRGYVLDVGPKFVMLSTCEEVRFDGFGCFRIADVKDLKPDPYAAFAETALKKLKIRAPNKPRVSVANVEELLRSANEQFPLVVIHRQTVDPGVCWIGRVEDINDGRVSLLEISPAAKWDKKPTLYKLSEITSVEFGGDYENALWVVGGKPK